MYNTRLFKLVALTEWQCQNCLYTLTCPPDEVNWENERMFAQGYEFCYRHEGYKDDCPFCHGSGWWRPGDDEDDEGSWDDDDPNDWDDEVPFDDPYFEDDGYYELED